MSRLAKTASVNPDSLRLLGALLLVTLSVAAPRWADAAPSISSAADQAFNIGDPTTASSAITIVDDSTPTITTANDIRIRIPSTFNMTWDTSVGSINLAGSASGKVDGSVSYEDGGQTVVIDVTSDFAGSDDLTLTGLSFTSFSAASAADNLELEVNNDDVVTDIDSKSITIFDRFGISSAANQTFTVGGPATLISTITITDDAATPMITTANDIRIRIPSTFNMTWDTSITTVTLGGPAAGKVSTTLKAYEDGDQTLVLDVDTDFVGGDQITVADPQFNSFSAPSAADNLELEVTPRNVMPRRRAAASGPGPSRRPGNFAAPGGTSRHCPRRFPAARSRATFRPMAASTTHSLRAGTTGRLSTPRKANAGSARNARRSTQAGGLRGVDAAVGCASCAPSLIKGAQNAHPCILALPRSLGRLGCAEGRCTDPVF